MARRIPWLIGGAAEKIRAFGYVFLIFSDYCRGSLRIGALMEPPVIYIFTHDSISVGEDGPTSRSSIWPDCAPSPG